MGGKSSKPEGGGFIRTASFRRSQKNALQRIERKLTKTSKDIDKFKGTIDDNKYTKIKQNITEVIDDLEKINASVKDKHKEAYQGILDRCHDELQKLDGKVTSSPSLSPVASPTPHSPMNRAASPIDSPLSERSSHSVQVKLVKIALDQAGNPLETTIERAKSKREEKTKEEIKNGAEVEQDTVDNIDAMRKKIEYLETEIHMYKKEPDEKLYGFIRENLSQIIAKLDNIDTYGNIQIKHERKLALQRAQECMKYLNDGAAEEEEEEAEIELHSEELRNGKERLSKRSTYRPITLDLNISEKFNEELHNVIHKRMEDATRESAVAVKSINAKLPAKSEAAATASTDESFENFENPNSEDEFDFVNVDDERDKSKSTPIFVYAKDASNTEVIHK